MIENPLNCFSDLEAIIFQTVLAIISGCDSWAEIELFGKTKGMRVKIMKVKGALDDEFRAEVLNI